MSVCLVTYWYKLYLFVPSSWISSHEYFVVKCFYKYLSHLSTQVHTCTCYIGTFIFSQCMITETISSVCKRACDGILGFGTRWQKCWRINIFSKSFMSHPRGQCYAQYYFGLFSAKNSNCLKSNCYRFYAKIAVLLRHYCQYFLALLRQVFNIGPGWSEENSFQGSQQLQARVETRISNRPLSSRSHPSSHDYPWFYTHRH